MELQGLLLAAGKGDRFGAPKLLQPLADGTPVGLASARNLLLALERVLVVLRPDDRELAALLEAEPGIETLACSEAELGLGRSLACGVRASADAGGWVVALGDMPWLRPETIAAVARRLRGGAVIAAPEFQGRRGHPVGFDNRFGPELMQLRGDTGARPLLRRYGRQVRLVSCNDPGCLADVDRPEDLQRGGLGHGGG